MKNSREALEIGTKVGWAALCRTHKETLSAIFDIICSYHTAKGLYLGKFLFRKMSGTKLLPSRPQEPRKNVDATIKV